MNEGEKKSKKVYKRGDVVTFRLLKKHRFSDNVLELLNIANATNSLNVEILEALELYARYKKCGDKLGRVVINVEDEALNEAIVTKTKEALYEDVVTRDIFEEVIKNEIYETDIIEEISKEIIENEVNIVDKYIKNDVKEDKNRLNRAFKGLRRNI